jgi:hypothetical protein
LRETLAIKLSRMSRLRRPHRINEWVLDVFRQREVSQFSFAATRSCSDRAVRPTGRQTFSSFVGKQFS